MNPRLTRDQLLRRGAAGVTFLSLPSLLAACGGGESGEARRWRVERRPELLQLAAYIDTAQNRKAAGLTGPTTLEQFNEKTGIKVNYYDDITDNADYFAKVQGPPLAGTGHRPRHLRLHRQLALPGAPRRPGVGAEAGQGPHPEHHQPHRRAGDPVVRPRARVLPAVVLGHDRDRLEHADRPRRSHRWTSSSPTRS